MPKTPNHGYNVPSKGTTDWNVPLNENFEKHDTDIEIRDTDANKGNYDPKDGAKFLATDTGIVYTGDGSNWVAVETTGPAPALSQVALGKSVLASQSKTFTVTNDDRTTLRVGPHETKTFSGNQYEAPNVVNGHESNSVADVIGATIAGGGAKNLSVSLTYANQVHANASFATIGGGNLNRVGGFGATVGGGEQNQANGQDSTVGAGLYNKATGDYSSALGGKQNTSSGKESTVGGGSKNVAGGDAATVPGGFKNAAKGAGSFAAGIEAHAKANGAFVWGDSSDQQVVSDQTNEFKVQAGGGAVIFSASDLSAGVNLAPGGGSWTSYSSRAAKANFESVEPSEVLDRVNDLDVQTWNYRAQDEEVRHMGPMAEEFADAFELGPDDEHIVNVDADGVALAAVQGLSERVEEKNERIEDLEATVERQRDEMRTLRDEHDTLRVEIDAIRDALDGTGGDCGGESN